MALKPARFKLDEEVSLGGKPMRVAGYVQYENPQEKLTTRYLLAAQYGPSQILEDRGDDFLLLRPFPVTTGPVASGSSVTVMGEKYTLSGVQKLKVLGALGEPPGGMPKAPLVLSGTLNGSMGTLVREISPGTAAAQVYYSVKPMAGAEVVSGAQFAAQQEAQRKAVEQQAAVAADEEDSTPGGWVRSAISTVATLLIIGGLGYACTSSDEEGYSGSSRSSFSFSVRRR
jgi:hypothetical protein